MCQLEIADIKEKDFIEFLKNLFSGWTMDDIYLIPRIFKKYTAAKAKIGKKRALKKVFFGKKSSEILDKLKLLCSFLKENTEDKMYTTKTLQVHKTKKRGSYIHSRNMSRGKFINFIMYLTIGCSSTHESGKLKKDYKGHNIYVTGWYLHYRVVTGSCTFAWISILLIRV